jgi:hypothetical protein
MPILADRSLEVADDRADGVERLRVEVLVQ